MRLSWRYESHYESLDETHRKKFLMVHTVKLAIWNLNSLSQHSHEITKYINLCKLDIILYVISETQLISRSYRRIQHYDIYSNRHPAGTAYGGSAVINRSSIKHHMCNNFQTEYIQATNVSIENWRAKITYRLFIVPHMIQSKIMIRHYFKIYPINYMAIITRKIEDWGSG